MAIFGGFGSTPTSFGNVGTSTAVPTLGAFGTTSTSAPTTATSTLGAFGGFGSGGNVAAPATGFNFGAPTTTTAAGFGFGGLGSTTTTPQLFGGFGLTTTATTTAPAFSFNPIAPTSTSAPSFAPSFGATGLGSSAFGATGPTFSSNLGTFGSGGSGLGRNTFGVGSGAFGSTAFGASSLGGGTFGSTSIGTGLGTFGQAGQTVNAGSALSNLTTALTCPLVFGDERDVVLAKWNKLQALWGVGKGVFASNGQYVDFTADNLFCRFKAIGYSCMPTNKNEDGFFAITINRKSSDVVSQQQQLVDSLHRILGSRPTVSVCVEGIKSVSDNKTEVILFVMERTPTGAFRRIPTTESFAFFNQLNIKNQLASMGIEGLIPKSAPTKEQLQQYLDSSPVGIDPLLWQQAKLDNPDPETLVPVPMIGFSDLQLRLKYQEQETKQHQGRLDIIASDIVELQRKHANMLARIAELKRKQLELGHRVLQVIVKQETSRKLGHAIQADEEQLRVQLEALLAELSAPTQFKGRLNELMSQIRMQNQQSLTRVEERYAVDANLQLEIKQLLKQQQVGLTHLVNVIRTDLEDLRHIERGLKENVQRRL